MLNWIVWNRTVFDIETVLMLNWIVWNRIIYLYKYKCNGNEGVLCLPQSSSITGTSPSDCLMSYSGHSLGGVLPFYRDTVVCWGCRIHWLHLCRGVRPPLTYECPRYDTKSSDGEAPVMLELWGMWSTPSLHCSQVYSQNSSAWLSPMYKSNKYLVI